MISTDLSHYHRYEDADRPRRADGGGDRRDADRTRSSDDDACGARPLRGLLQVADRRRLGVDLLDLRNSGDTRGDRERVVGYGAFAVA